jgi:hypothetical protein
MNPRATAMILLCTAAAAAAQVRISELPEATNTAGSQFVIIQGGATKRIGETFVRTIPATNVTGLGPFAIATNLSSSNISDFSNAVVAVAPPTTNASLLTAGTLNDARLSTNVVLQSALTAALATKLGTNGTLPAANITGLGPFATATNLTSANVSDFASAVIAAAPPTTNASLLTAGLLDDARLSTNVARTSQLAASNIVGLGAFATATNLVINDVSGLQTVLDGKLGTNTALSASNVVGAAWALETRSHSFYATSGYTLAAGRNVQLNITFPAIGATGTVTLPRRNTDGAQEGDDLFVVAIGFGQGQSLVIERFVWTGSNYISAKEVAVTTTNNGAWRFRLLSGVWTIQPVAFHQQPASTIVGLGPLATATNITILGVTGLQSALDGKLATNGTLPATNITGLGPFATATNLLITNISGLSAALDGKLATNGTLPAANITGLGPFATAANLSSSNIGDFSNAVVAFAPPSTPTTNASALTTGTLDDARLSTNVVLASSLVASNITGLGPFATATNLSSSNIGDFGSAVAGALTDGAANLYVSNLETDSNLTVGGDLVVVNAFTVGGNGIYFFEGGDQVTKNNLGLGQTNIPIFANVELGSLSGSGSGYLVRSSGGRIGVAGTNLSTGTVFFYAWDGFENSAFSVQSTRSNLGLGPFATATNLAITNISGLSAALDGKLATNGTLPAANITGLGPFATATNLTSSNIGDFSNAVVAFAPPSTPTTNASALTTGTLDDARLSTNVVFASSLVASNITGLGPFATATNLTSSNISDFNAAVTALVGTNTGGGIAWTNAPSATNSTGTPGQVAYEANYFYMCVATNTWRRVLLGTW